MRRLFVLIVVPLRNLLDRGNIVTLASFVAFCLSQAYILPKLLSAVDGLDFRLIWLAGKLWSAGLDPYGPAFTSAYLSQFGTGPITHFWLYPPSWWIISTPFSRLEFESAVLVWNLLNYFCILGGSWIATRKIERTQQMPTFLLLAAIVSTMQDAAVALAIGQTAFIVYLGIALFCYGWRQRTSPALVAGLLILSLKPNIGIAFFAIALLRRDALMAAIVAGIITLMALAPILSVETLKGFLHAVARYGASEMTANAPANLTGAAQVLDLVGLAAPTLTLVLCGALAAMLAARKSLALAVPAVAFFVPLHAYDLAFVFLAVPLSLRIGWEAVGYVMLWRAGNFASIMNIANPQGDIFPSSLMASGAILIVMVSLIMVMLLQSGERRIAQAP